DAATQEGPAGRVAIEVLRHRYEIAQDVDLLGVRLAAAEQNLRALLQPEHPERQVERTRVDAHAIFRQRAGEFVVRVEDQHTQIRTGLDRLAHQKRDRGRLADAGRADDGEVAGQRVVYRDARLDVFV